MDRFSRDLQYMVREPIEPHPSFYPFMHGFIKKDEVLRVEWRSRRGKLFVDGCHVFREVEIGDVIEFSANGPELKVFLNEK